MLNKKRLLAVCVAGKKSIVAGKLYLIRPDDRLIDGVQYVSVYNPENGKFIGRCIADRFMVMSGVG